MAKCLFCCDDFCCCGGGSSDGSSGNGSGYTLKPATTSRLGGIIVGNGLEVKGDGTLNVTLVGSGSSSIPVDYISERYFIDYVFGTSDYSSSSSGSETTSGGNSDTVAIGDISEEDFIDYVFGEG